MANEKMNLAEEMSVRSRRFWYGLSILFDLEKKQLNTVQDAIRVPFDSHYILEWDKDYTSIYNDEDPTKKARVKNNQKDDFPYCKLLDWYLKETVLKGAKR